MSPSATERPERPKLVLFDLDDTLCDHDRALRMRVKLAFAAASEGIEGVDLDTLVDAAVARSVFGTDHFAEVLATAGVTGDDRLRRAVEAYVGDRYLGLELFEEAVDVVNTIKRQARVGMITNGPSEIQRNKILRLGIVDLFPFVIVSEEAGVWKPDPAIFERALELGEARPDEAVYVGDTPEHDVAGAKAAGVTAVWINRPGREWPGGPEPDYEIHDLRELLDLFGFDQPDDQ